MPPSLPGDCGQQPHTVPSKSSPRHVPSRALAVPLGQREHTWLVAASAGQWAQVRGLFLEEPELALLRDFMSGFTVLHWLAKHASRCNDPSGSRVLGRQVLCTPQGRHQLLGAATATSVSGTVGLGSQTPV
ncbi:PREDICTED: ankyrin repeat domain-containing protein SOWAHB-like [Chaetura pelagica]|uniref:ankyrin repeat domain-containing protein SOWAHB-like n=1 Tax=Chaetura pelagica TaxID=8897 RepID=UPI00052347C8|nr:PREDICTED: ankyrin repeat domain-containing protein SOWAHB-like [Chaetura pelagica]